METHPEFMTYKQAKDLLGLKTYNALRTYIDEGKSKRIKRSDIIEFMEAHKQVSK